MGLARTRPDGGAQADSDEFRRYEAALRSYFRRRAPAPQVDDLVQEALARLIATQQDTQVQTPLAYLFRIASNLMADRARAQRREPTLEWDEDDGWDDQGCAAPDQESGLLFAYLRGSDAAAMDEWVPQTPHVFREPKELR